MIAVVSCNFPSGGTGSSSTPELRSKPVHSSYSSSSNSALVSPSLSSTWKSGSLVYSSSVNPELASESSSSDTLDLGYDGTWDELQWRSMVSPSPSRTAGDSKVSKPASSSVGRVFS